MMDIYLLIEIMNKLVTCSGAQAEAALAMQNMALSVLQQPRLDGLTPEFESSADKAGIPVQKINEILGEAQTFVKQYLEHIHPKVIQNIANIDGILSILGVSVGGAQWSAVRDAISGQVQKHMAHAKGIHQESQSLLDNLRPALKELEDKARELRPVVSHQARSPASSRLIQRINDLLEVRSSLIKQAQEFTASSLGMATCWDEVGGYFQQGGDDGQGDTKVKSLSPTTPTDAVNKLKQEIGAIKMRMISMQT